MVLPIYKSRTPKTYGCSSQIWEPNIDTHTDLSRFSSLLALSLSSFVFFLFAPPPLLSVPVVGVNLLSEILN
ncbi:hypothetical protein QN277_019917 [Acacia crassicarpa]|uniref:Uncharacterized protein n=1 Tax=Acacia crassicarpa TaxID=499986 RepID=A0AAE1KCD4_9FABA|nr:hypothetical protein QN277_019917 [Acacia crassicarpa]